MLPLHWAHWVALHWAPCATGHRAFMPLLPGRNHVINIIFDARAMQSHQSTRLPHPMPSRHTPLAATHRVPPRWAIKNGPAHNRMCRECRTLLQDVPEYLTRFHETEPSKGYALFPARSSARSV